MSESNCSSVWFTSRVPEVLAPDEERTAFEIRLLWDYTVTLKAENLRLGR